MLQDLGNIGQALAALVAIFGIPLAIRQLRMQNRISQLDVLRDLEHRWSHRADRVEQEHQLDTALVSAATRDTVRDLFAASGARPAFSAEQVNSSFPRSLMTLSPDLDAVMDVGGDIDISVAGPKNEREYQDVLLRRCRIVFPMLDKLAASENADHRSDLRKVIQIVYNYAASLSDVAEMFDFGLADPEQFMEKRHLAVIRDAHIIEPFILWQATRTGDHRSVRGLRALALGAAARSYTWLTDLHGVADISLRYESRNHLEETSYGPILQSGTTLTWLPRRLRWRWLRVAVGRPFRDHTKQAQNRLIDRAEAIVG